MDVQWIAKLKAENVTVRQQPYKFADLRSIMIGARAGNRRDHRKMQAAPDQRIE
jgi:hypothetical protein